MGPWWPKRNRVSESRLADRVVRIVWPLLARQRPDGRRFERIEAEVAWVRAQLLRLNGGGAPAQASGAPFPPVPAPGDAVRQYARGSLLRGQPLMGVPGYPDQVALMTQDEPGVSNFRGWAAQTVADGDPVDVWFRGPCPLFSGLETNPTPPDSLELYVYGPHPPVRASQIPPDAYFRRCGEVLDGQTCLLDKGDKTYNPAP